MTQYQSPHSERSPEQQMPPAVRMITITRSVALAERALSVSPFAAQPELAQRVLRLYRSQVPAQRVVEQATVSETVPEPQPDHEPTEQLDLNTPVPGMDASYIELLMSANQAARPAAETNHDIQETHR